MSNKEVAAQLDDLRKDLKRAVYRAGYKKGTEWAKETKAELQATDYPITMTAFGALDIKDKSVDFGRMNYVAEVASDNVFSLGSIGNNFRITPQDTGNLITSISYDDNSAKVARTLNGDLEFSVGVDYTKLNLHKAGLSRYLERKGRPNRWVKRPGRRKSGAYVEAANENSDELPYFLETWRQRGEANVKRIFR